MSVAEVEPPDDELLRPDVLICSECGTGPFKGPQGLAAHRRSAHDVVGSSSSSRYQRKRKTAGKTATCETCGKEYASADSLRKHVKRMHTAKDDEDDSIDVIGLDVMIQHLFPDGVPKSKIPDLLRWIDATRDLVR